MPNVRSGKTLKQVFRRLTGESFGIDKNVPG
jgi:hypothetical protein